MVFQPIPYWLVVPIIALLACGFTMIIRTGLMRHLALYKQRLRKQNAKIQDLGNQLLEQQRQIRSLFQFTPDCLKIHTADGTLQEINRAGAAILDCDDADSLIGKSVYQYIAPEHHDRHRAFTQSIFRGESGSLEFDVITRNGCRKPLETYALPLRNTQGEIDRVLAITRNTPERKRIIERLDCESRLRTIVESEPECVKLLARDGTVIDINPAGMNLVGVESADQIVGQSIYKYVYEEHLEAYRQLTEDVFKGRKGMLQFQTVSETGERRWMETHAAPLRDRNGEIVALLGITRDIQDRKLAEERVRQHQLDLEHVCRVSTLGEMSSTLAHELNQPLCAISSYAQACIQLLQANRSQLAVLNDTLDQIVSQAERASSIIGRLREWVRKKTPDRRSVSVDRLINEANEIIQPELDVNAVSLKNEIAAHLPSVYVDPIQIEQVIINLERNAVEAMRETSNGRELIVQASAVNSDSVEIAVCDNGPGVPETLADKIFDSYFTTKRSGIGMGLSIARSIIESHGGAICYRARGSGGAVFRLTLPVSSASVAKSS